MGEVARIFQGHSVLRILDGIKTQTRRPLPARLLPTTLLGGVARQEDGTWTAGADVVAKAHRVRAGDVMWVREAHAYAPRAAWPSHRLYGFGSTGRRELMQEPGTRRVAFYAADWGKEGPFGRWRSPLFMHRWACRALLEVTATRLERLNTISEADAIREGIAKITDPSRAYLDAWDVMHRGTKHTTSADPVIAVITFRLLPRPTGLLDVTPFEHLERA